MTSVLSSTRLRIANRFVAALVLSVLLSSLTDGALAQTASTPTSIVVHTPTLVQAPGTNAVLYAQVYDQFGEPMSGQTVRFDIRGSSDNNFQSVMTRYGGPSGDGGLVSMVYTRYSESEDVILITPTGSFAPGVQTTAAAHVTFSQTASPVSDVGEPAQRVYVANTNRQPMTVGNSAKFQVNVFDASNHPVNGTRVTFQVVGVSSYSISGYTDHNGEINFYYTGWNDGVDVVLATVAAGAPGATVQAWTSTINPCGVPTAAALSLPDETILITHGWERTVDWASTSHASMVAIIGEASSYLAGLDEFLALESLSEEEISVSQAQALDALLDAAEKSRADLAAAASSLEAIADQVVALEQEPAPTESAETDPSDLVIDETFLAAMTVFDAMGLVTSATRYALDQVPSCPLLAQLGGIILQLESVVSASTGTLSNIAEHEIENASEEPGPDPVLGGGCKRFPKEGGGYLIIGGDETNDTCYGSTGDDEFRLYGGADTAYGFAGDDVFRMGSGTDTAYGADGFDILLLGPGNDVGEGGTDNDQINAGTGHDQVWGEEGHDYFILLAGDDRPYGGSGNDQVHGDAGNDLLWANDGHDIFIDDGAYYLDDIDAMNGGNGRDYARIYDTDYWDGFSGDAGDDPCPVYDADWATGAQDSPIDMGSGQTDEPGPYDDC